MSKENFYKLKAKLEETRLLTMQRRPSDVQANLEESAEDDINGAAGKLAVPGSERLATEAVVSSLPLSKPLAAKTCHGMEKALRSRVPAIRSGELLSIVFIRYTISFLSFCMRNVRKMLIILYHLQDKNLKEVKVHLFGNHRSSCSSRAKRSI